MLLVFQWMKQLTKWKNKLIFREQKKLPNGFECSIILTNLEVFYFYDRRFA